MCGRFALVTDEYALKKQFGLMSTFVNKARYNLAPGHMIPVIKDLEQIDFLRWGFLQQASTTQIGCINVNLETMYERRFAQRCIVPCSGYYEWRLLNNKKQPYYVFFEQGLVGMAAVWGGERCAIVTVLQADGERVPLIVDPTLYTAWLSRKKTRDKGVALFKQAQTLSVAFQRQCYPVSIKINNPSFDSAACIVSLDIK